MKFVQACVGCLVIWWGFQYTPSSIRTQTKLGSFWYFLEIVLPLLQSLLCFCLFVCAFVVVVAAV